MFRNHEVWTENDDSTLREHYTTATILELQHMLGRTPLAIKQRSYHLKLNRQRPSSRADFEQSFRDAAGNSTVAELALKFDIARSTVNYHKRRFGIADTKRGQDQKGCLVVCERIPTYATAGSAGVDLMTVGDYAIMPRECVKVRTGLRIAIPPGYEGQVRARSGLAFKYKLTLMNGVGTIDSDYRDEVCVLLVNHGLEVVQLKEGDRIAQMVFARVERLHMKQVEVLPTTERKGGFGSTGTQ